MNNELQIFNNEEFGKVRTIEIEGKPYFVANDVAKALGYIETAKAIRTHCKGVSEMDIPTNGGIQTMKIISEGDIYRLIIKSKLPSAERFEKWVMDEVLPTLRKTGEYKIPQSREVQIAQALILANELIEEMKPKAAFYDDVRDAKDAIKMNDCAKVLGIGRNKLFKKLRDMKIIMDGQYNPPYQKYVDCGYFKILYKSYHDPFGNTHTYTQTYVLPKGVEFLHKTLKEVN